MNLYLVYKKTFYVLSKKKKKKKHDWHTGSNDRSAWKTQFVKIDKENAQKQERMRNERVKPLSISPNSKEIRTLQLLVHVIQSSGR